MKEVCILISGISLTPCTVTVSPQDIDDNAKLPPKNLMAGSRLNLVPPDTLSKLNTIKRNFSTLALKYGFEFNGLTIVPRDREEDLLQQIQEEVIIPGNAERDRFLAQYDDSVQAHINANPDWADLIRKHKLSLADVSARIKFDCLTVPFMATESSFGQKQFLSMKQQLVPSLVTDISLMAKKILEGPVGTSDRFKSSSLGPVNELLWKLNGFRLLDHRIGKVCEALKDVIAACPVSGPIHGTQAYMLTTLVKQMANTNTLLDITKTASVQTQLLVDDEAPAAIPSIPAPAPAPKPAVQQVPVVTTINKAPTPTFAPVF